MGELGGRFIVSDLGRVRRIEETALSHMNIHGSFIMLSHDDYDFLLKQAKNNLNNSRKGEAK